MPFVQQGGAISVRTESDDPHFLVATARTNDEHWVFPKSEMEEGEPPEDAAIRELSECGVEGEFSGRVGSSTFQAGDRRVKVTYFLIHAVSETESTTGRQTEWLPYAQARERLTFDDARQMLEKAASGLTTRSEI